MNPDENDGGSGPQGSGDQGSKTGGQSPSGNTGPSLADFETLLDKKLGPLASDVQHLKNAEAARRRVASRQSNQGQQSSDEGEGGQGGDGAEGADGSRNRQPQIQDPATRQAFEQLQRENRAMADRERKREADEKKARCDRKLDKLLADTKCAKPDVLKKMLKPYVREGEGGEILFDDGDDIRPLEEVVRDHLAQDMFRPASGSNGTGTPPGGGPPKIGGDNGQPKVDMSLPATERLAQIRRQQAGQA